MDTNGKMSGITLIVAVVIVVAVVGGALYVGTLGTPSETTVITATARATATATTTATATATTTATKTTTAAPPTTPEKTDITFMISWIPSAQFVGNYVALGKGFYEDAGLNVEIQVGQGSTFVTQVIGTGGVDIGISTGPTLITGRTKGVPAKSVALLHVHNPTCFITLDPDIQTPHDFVGKRIGIARSSTTSIIYDVLMEKLGIDTDLITEVPLGYDAIGPILADLVDAANDYDVEIYRHSLKAPDIRLIRAVDYDVDMYNHAIIANDSFIKHNPNTVRAVVAATLEGWNYAREHEEEAIEILLSYNPDLDYDAELGTLGELWKSTMRWDDWGAFGYSDTDGWLNVQKLLFDSGFITSELTDIQDIFTNEFLP